MMMDVSLSYYDDYFTVYFNTQILKKRTILVKTLGLFMTKLNFKQLRCTGALI